MMHAQYVQELLEVMIKFISAFSDTFFVSLAIICSLFFYVRLFCYII